MIRPTTVIVSKLNDDVGVVFGHAVVGEQGVQEGTKHAPHVEDQRGRCGVAYPYKTGGGPSGSSGSSCSGRCFCPRVLSLVIRLEGTMVLNAGL